MNDLLVGNLYELSQGERATIHGNYAVSLAEKNDVESKQVPIAAFVIVAGPN